MRALLPPLIDRRTFDHVLAILTIICGGGGVPSCRGDLLAVALPTLLLIGTLIWVSRKTASSMGGSLFSVGKHKATLFTKDMKVRFFY